MSASELAPTPAPLSLWALTLLLLVAGLVNTALWLDSLDTYLETRWQGSVSAWLPPAAFKPSRTVAAWLGASLPWTDKTSAPEGQAPRPFQGPLKALPAGAYWPNVAQQKAVPGPQRILFAGDSMMQGVAPFVMRELAQAHPDWQMTDASKHSTGLTARRLFDWPRTIAQATTAQQLTWVVIFLGPNDPRDMFLPDKRVSFPSPEWLENYVARVDEILAHAVQHRVRVIWLGLPAMREDRLQRGVAVLNHIYYDRAQAFGTDYLATEPLIGVASLPFQKYQPDERGQWTPLRTEDGTHFTPAGLRKISQALVQHMEKASQP